MKEKQMIPGKLYKTNQWLWPRKGQDTIPISSIVLFLSKDKTDFKFLYKNEILTMRHIWSDNPIQYEMR